MNVKIQLPEGTWEFNSEQWASFEKIMRDLEELFNTRCVVSGKIMVVKYETKPQGFYNHGENNTP